MQLSSTTFLYLFLPFLLVAYYFPLVYKRNGLRNLLLFLASLVFYLWSGLEYALLLLLSIIVNYGIGRWVENYKNQIVGKRIVALACLYNLVMLFVFKYVGSIISGITGLMGVESDSIFLTFALPLGISFYTFRALSYVIDTYRGTTPAQKNIITLGLYLSFFPVMISGPNVKYHDMEKQFASRESNVHKFSEGIQRFAIGLCKSVIIGSQLKKLVEYAFAMEGNELSVGFAWGGALAYMLYIYFDFSGYSDMAIGVGKMFGFDLPENFDYPYISRSVSEYWRRWHITLSQWFQEYLYYPFASGPAVKIRKLAAKYLERKKAVMLYKAVSILIVWLATGIWHGANWTYIVWGLLNFVAVFIDAYWKPKEYTKVTSIVAWLLTFLFIMFADVIFNASSMASAVSYIASMLHLNGNVWMDIIGAYRMPEFTFYIILGIVFAIPVAPWLRKKVENLQVWQQTVCNVVWMVGLMAAFVLAVAFVVGAGYNPPAYANF